ncbi:MAG TPA: hypothetical protein VFL83_12410 [Anaeromyxobacter sp.]|nr:hypothetical protein [Anaeromyxobacter sp.]
MTTLHSLLVFLHVLAISAWIAAALWVAGDVKRALAMGKPHVDALAARIRPALGLDAVAGVAAIVTGALLLWEQGMTHPRPGISAGIVLALVRLFLLAGMRRAWRGLLARIQAGEAVPADDRAARRMSMLSGIAHLMWLLALAGMVFPV